MSMRLPLKSALVELLNQRFGCNESIGILDDSGDLFPVRIDVELHAEPPTMSNVGRHKEPFWLKCQ